MNGPQCYVEAERLLEAALADVREADPSNKVDYAVRLDRASIAIAAAAVRAELAVAAATVDSFRPVLPLLAWSDALDQEAVAS